MSDNAELSEVERLWLATIGVDLNDPRIKPIRRPISGTEQVIDFDVAGNRGVVRIGYHQVAVTLRGTHIVDGRVEFSASANVDPATWLPWVIEAGPDELVGTKYDDLAQAVRVALTGRRPTDG